MHADHEVLVVVDFLIVSDPQKILNQVLRPHPIYLLNIIIIFISSNIFNWFKKNKDTPNQSWKISHKLGLFLAINIAQGYQGK